MRIARAFTNPFITLRGIKRIKLATPPSPKAIWIIPANNTAETRYSTPWFFTSGAMTNATDPAAAVTIAGLPPVKAIATHMTNDVNKPTRGSTPSTIEKEITSGMRASEVTTPPKISVRNRPHEEKADRKEPTVAGWSVTASFTLFPGKCFNPLWTSCQDQRIRRFKITAIGRRNPLATVAPY